MTDILDAPMQTFEHVLVDVASPVAHITMNRPDRRNALSMAHMRDMIAALDSVRDDSRVHVVTIGGAGPIFSAGHDLSEMMDRSMSFYRELFDVCTQMMETIHRMPQPVIAKVHGVATAAGCQLVAACDLAVATDDARFATPGVKIGLFCSTPMVPISRAVGRKRAMQMLLTGEFIDAATAVDWGLINQAVPADELETAVDDLIASITRFSPAVLGIGKVAFWSQIELDEHRAYDHTKAVMSTNAAAADAQEGMGAFLGKREPNWPAEGQS